MAPWLLLGWAALALLPAAQAQLEPSAPALSVPPPPEQRFGPKDQMLDLGIQPLWVPTSAVTETMKRDRVLAGGMARLGMGVRFHPFRLGPEGNAQLGPEGLDGMMAGDMPALVAVAEKDLTIATLVHQGFAALVAKGPRSVAELRGKRVVYAPGSSTHFTLLKVLQMHGVRTEQVYLAPSLDLTEWAEDLRAGRISAISAWDPLTMVVTKTVPGAVVLHRSLFEGYLYFTHRAVERHPRAVRLVIASQLRAMAWMGASPANLRRACQWALDEHRRFSGVSAPITPEEYAALIKASLLDVAPLPEVDEEQLGPQGDIKAKYDFLIQQRAIPAGTPFARIQRSFDREMVLGVIADPALYELGRYDYDDQDR